MSAPTLPDICAQTALEAGRSGEKERKLNVHLSVAHLYERRRSARKRSNLRVCRTWTFTRGHKRDATSERGAAFSSQSPKAGHWTPRAKVYIQIPGHLTSTVLNFLQYIRLCHIQISGQMQTPKVFLLLSCILHQYRTSAKAFSVQDPPQGRFKEIVLWKGVNPTKLCFSVKFWRDRISGRSYFNVFWTKACILPYHCDLQKFCVLTCNILAGQVSISPYVLQIAPPLPLNQ